MSKSKNNGVDPQGLIEQYGADTARLFMMFAAPPEQTLEWSDSGVQGAYRFLKRLWTFAAATAALLGTAAGQRSEAVDWTVAGPEHLAVRREVHQALRQVNYDMGKHQFNTVVSGAMKILNTLERAPTMTESRPGQKTPTTGYSQIIYEGLSILLRLLAPITPHIVHNLWKEFEFGGDIIDAPWPEVDESALMQDEIELVVQVSGKLRGRITVAAQADAGAIESTALGDANVMRFTDGKVVKKIVIVPGKLVNIVVA